jgi:hypothetical protein
LCVSPEIDVTKKSKKIEEDKNGHWSGTSRAKGGAEAPRTAGENSNVLAGNFLKVIFCAKGIVLKIIEHETVTKLSDF